MFQIMKLLKACPSSVTSDMRNVVTGVCRWAKRLRGKGNDHAWSDFMVSKFQHHMEEGSFNRPISRRLVTVTKKITSGKKIRSKQDKHH